MHNKLQSLKIQIEYLNKGIVPLDPFGGLSAWHDVNKALATMPAAEARQMKRKFRKAWRKIVTKCLGHGGRNGKRLAKTCGYGKEIPTRGEKQNRKHCVIGEINKKIRKQNEKG